MSSVSSERTPRMFATIAVEDESGDNWCPVPINGAEGDVKDVSITTGS